jgi:hypothetical protein
VDAILGDLRDAKNQKGVAVLEDTVGNTMKKVTKCFDSFQNPRYHVVLLYNSGFCHFCLNYEHTQVGVKDIRKRGIACVKGRQNYGLY